LNVGGQLRMRSSCLFNDDLSTAQIMQRQKVWWTSITFWCKCGRKRS